MDVIDEMFDGPALYPGSKRTRKAYEKTEIADAPGQALSALMDPATWGIPPVQKTIQGKPMTLYTLGALANALQRPIITIRLWENMGRLPEAPFRAEHVAGPGGKVGRRYYSQRSINEAQLEFYKRGVLGAPRIEWSDHEDLTEAIAFRWQKEIEDFLEEVNNTPV
jgi:hypothetical protein